MAKHKDHDQHKCPEAALLLEKIDQLSVKLDTIVSKITDFAAAEQVDLTTIATDLNAIVAGVASLDTLITNFQNSPGTLNATDQAALDGIVASSKSLVGQVSAIDVTAPQVAATARTPQSL
jgi:hypothetical protein